MNKRTSISQTLWPKDLRNDCYHADFNVRSNVAWQPGGSPHRYRRRVGIGREDL